MTSRSSQCPIFCASFNQDNSGFSVSTKDGFKIFDSNTGRLCYERAVGAFVIVEMLYSTSLLAIVGAGEQPSLSPRRLCLFNTTTGAALRELNFLTSILAVRLNKKRVVVVLQEKTYIYDTNTLAILDTIDTVSNTKGLCAFSPSLDGCFLALPASTIKGSVLVYNVMELNSHCEIDAHRAPLAAIALSSNGMYIATASEQGTIIRVHLVSDATKSYSFRRGTYPSTIFSLSFGPSAQLPDILVATSSSGSIHVFSLGFAMHQSPVPVNYEMGFSLTGISGQEPQAVLSNVFKGSFFFFFLYFRVFFYVCVQSHVIQGLDKLSDPSCLHLSRSRRSSSFLGSILPNSVNDVLDPAYHHVLRKAVPAGVKSHIVVRNVEKVGEKSSTVIEACRATLSVITYDGYFLEYVVNVNNQNESKWSLEREFNLLTAMSGEEQNFQLV